MSKLFAKVSRRKKSPLARKEFAQLTVLVNEEREDKRTIISPPAKRHLMAFRWRAYDGPTSNNGLVIFQGIRTSIAKNPYIFVIFQGGSLPPVPPSGSAHDGL